MVQIGKIQIGKGLLLLLAILFYVNGPELLGGTLLACALHECGHILVILAQGEGVDGLSLGLTGAELRLSGKRCLSHWGEVAAAAAGPAVNILLSFCCAGVWSVFSGINLILALFNLLPVWPLDGGRILYFALSAISSQELALKAGRMGSLLISAAIMAAGTALAWESGYNFTLFFAGVWLTALAQRGKRVAKGRRNG